MDPMDNCLKPGDRHVRFMALPFQSPFLYAIYSLAASRASFSPSYLINTKDLVLN